MVSEGLWLFRSVFKRVCVVSSVYERVCGPVQNKSGHSSAESACAEHIRVEAKRQAFIPGLVETSAGTRCLSRARNLFV